MGRGANQQAAVGTVTSLSARRLGFNAVAVDALDHTQRLITRLDGDSARISTPMGSWTATRAGESWTVAGERVGAHTHAACETVVA